MAMARDRLSAWDIVPYFSAFNGVNCHSGRPRYLVGSMAMARDRLSAWDIVPYFSAFNGVNCHSGRPRYLVGSMAMARDRLSSLDDNLLCSHILSKLCLRDAIRCSLLSRRWRSLWAFLTHLKFSTIGFKVEVIDHIMFFNFAELESLEISLFHLYGIGKRNVGNLFWKWVRSASLKRVKQITLESLEGFVEHVPTSLFYCDCLTFLKLEYFEFKRLPTYLWSFNCLLTCFLSDINMNDEILEQIVAKCPLLQNLTVKYCLGLSNLKISSVNIKYLDFTSCARSVIVNCPQLATLTVLGFPPLRLELNSCGALLELHCWGDLHLSTTKLKVLEGLSTNNELSKITINELSTDVPSLAVLGRFVYLEELWIESKSFKAASEAAKSWTVPLKAMKKVHVKVSRFDEEEIALLSCLLISAPFLQTMIITVPICSEYVHKQSFLKQLLGLKRSSGEATVLITENLGEDCKRCLEKVEKELCLQSSGQIEIISEAIVHRPLKLKFMCNICGICLMFILINLSLEEYL